MFVVIFEVQPRPEHWDTYLAHAAALRPELARIDGFIANDRFRSRTREGWLVSLSTWRDEKSLVRWRAHGQHHAVQADGRARVFADYRLRVGAVIADTAPGAAPAPFAAETTETDPARTALLIEAPNPVLDSAPDPAGALFSDRFDAILDPGAGLRLSLWRQAGPPMPPLPGARCRLVRIVRSYGMHDRAEAPQFHAPAPAAG